MRTTRTEMVPKEITTYKCDLCDFTTENNRGCCGSAPVMYCDICRQDVCRSCRGSFYEDDNQDYPDMMVCSDCLPKAQICWDLAKDFVGRYEILSEVMMKIYNNFDEYKDCIDED